MSRFDSNKAVSPKSGCKSSLIPTACYALVISVCFNYHPQSLFEWPFFMALDGLLPAVDPSSSLPVAVGVVWVWSVLPRTAHGRPPRVVPWEPCYLHISRRSLELRCLSHWAAKLHSSAPKITLLSLTGEGHAERIKSRLKGYTSSVKPTSSVPKRQVTYRLLRPEVNPLPWFWAQQCGFFISVAGMETKMLAKIYFSQLQNDQSVHEEWHSYM